MGRDGRHPAPAAGKIVYVSAPEYLTKEQASFLSDASLLAVMAAIENAGGQVRVNGGAVRNALLGVAIGDVDLSTTLTPAHVTEVLQRTSIKVVPTGLEHGTVTAVHGGKGFEITTLREDIETDGRRAVVQFGSDWVADASRRDFTMNALYCDRNARLYDPLGGFTDLMARRLRFIGDPDARIAEDRLRILRFFRFFAWYGDGRPDAASLKACARNKDGLLQLSAERVWHELKRLLSAPDPVKALLWMRTAGVLDIVLPESTKWGTDLLPRLASAEKALGWKPDPMLRLMAVIPPREETTTALSGRLKLSKIESMRLTNWANAKLMAGPPDAISGQLLYHADSKAVLDRLKLERARLEDARGEDIGRANAEAMISFVGTWEKPVFPLKGTDLLATGNHPGPQLGKMLARMEEAWVKSGFALDRESLLKLSPDE